MPKFTTIQSLDNGLTIVDVEQVSPFNGKPSTMRMMLDLGDVEDWEHGTLIQTAMPYLTADQREFLISGITPEEWEKAFA